MKKALFVLMAALLSVSGIMAANEKELVLLYPSGKETKTDLAAIGKLVFSTDSVYLVSHSGECLGQEAKGKIQHIRFAEKTGSGMENEIVSGITIYPNPTTSTLIIKGIEYTTSVHVYSTNGQLQSTATLSQGENALSVENLGEGMYLLQIGTEVVRFMKK